MAEDSDGPVLDQINLVVRDMEPMVAFYRRLGLPIDEVPADWADWAPHHRTVQRADGLSLDLDSLGFTRVWNQGLPGDHARAVIGFRLPTRDAVDRTYEDLTQAGHGSQQPPYDAFWGARYAVVEDPDGNSVGLMSPIDTARRTPSPTPPQ